jgi:hypothetical protein
MRDGPEKDLPHASRIPPYRILFHPDSSCPAMFIFSVYSVCSVGKALSVSIWSASVVTARGGAAL